MERVCISRPLQEMLRTCRRRHICLSFGGVRVGLDGLRNFSQSRHGVCLYKHGHSIGNLRLEIRNSSGLFRQYLQRTESRTVFGVNVYQIGSISTSARRFTGEKGSEEGSNEDNEKAAQQLKTRLIYLFVVATLLQVSLYKSFQNLPVLDTYEELRNIILNSEVERIKFENWYLLGELVKFLRKDSETGMTKGNVYLIKNKEAFQQNLRTIYMELGMDPSEKIQTTNFFGAVVLEAVTLMMLAGVVLFGPKRSIITNSKQGRNFLKKINNQQGRNHTKKVNESFDNQKVEKKTMMEMLLGDRINAGYVRGDILSKQGNAVTFEEVAGLKEAKYEVMEFVDYLKSSENVTKLGGKHPRGVLLLGPPGCGKTLLAKAVATEAGVPFFALAGSQFVEMFGGLGASRMRNLFKEARQQAPCIIYVDEIDAIGKKRTGSEQGSEEEHTLNQLLVELDGMGTTEGVIMMASTNRSDVLDKALMRPGRFDRQIQIDFPTVDEREEIFHVYMKKLKMTIDYKALAPRLAQLTTGMSGADIANICNEAALHAARHANDSVSMGDFYFAIERIVAGAEKKRSVITQEDRKVVAYHEAGHALVGWLLKHTDALLQVSIVPRTNNTLGFAQLAPQDNYLYSNQQLFDRMCMMLGGRAAENITFNHVTSGAQDDLAKVTKQAYTQIQSWGMNDRVGCVSYDFSEKSLLLPYSKSLSNVMDEEVKKLVAKAYMATQNLLMENKVTLDLLASTLLEKESLTYDQVRSLIGPPPHGDKIKLETMKILSEAAKEAASQSKPTAV